MNHFLESCDYLQLLELQDSLNKSMNFDSLNEDNKVMISMYDTHRFILEQNYEISTALCVPLTEGVISNIKERIKKIFDKIITFLTNLGEWLKKKINELRKKSFKKIGMQVFKQAEKKDSSLKLVRIEVPNEYASMTNYSANPSDSKIFSYTIDAANELLDFYSDNDDKKNMEYLDDPNDKKEYFLKACPNYKKLADECDGNFKNITPFMFKELGIPETDKKIIIGGECSPTEYLSKYFDNAEKVSENLPKNINFRDFDMQFIQNDIFKLREKAVRNASKLGEKAYSQFTTIVELLWKIINTQSEILISIIKAHNAHQRNFIKCYNTVYPKNKIIIKDDENKDKKEE